MAVAAAHHMSLDGIVDPDALLARLTNHTPSLVQDYLQGRPMEIDQLLKAPQAFARQAGVPTPTLDALVAIGAQIETRFRNIKNCIITRSDEVQ